MSEAWAELVAAHGPLGAVLWLVGMTMAVLLWTVTRGRRGGGDRDGGRGAGVTDTAAVLRLLRLRGAEGVTPLLALQEVGCFRLSGPHL
jgi:hypothetical protein